MFSFNQDARLLRLYACQVLRRGPSEREEAVGRTLGASG
jgi:hypothetical protein